MAKKTHKPEQKNANVELENQLKRALADYANLQKRSEEEKKAVIRFANTVLLVKFLDILDGLEAAVSAHPSEGLDLVIKKFKDVLTAENVAEITTQGNFNPEFHEGIAIEEAEKPGEIVEVLQKGYTLDGKVLRPARVKVTVEKRDSNG